MNRKQNTAFFNKGNQNQGDAVASGSSSIALRLK